MHPLVRLAASRPQMLAEHAAAYVELFAEEATTAATHVKRQVSLQLIGVGLHRGGRDTRRRRRDVVGVLSDAELAVGSGADAVCTDPERRDCAALRFVEERPRPVRTPTTPTGRRCGNAATRR